MSYDISPAARPIYDDQIDGKDDEKADEKDITVAPAELTFGEHHLDATEQSHIRRDLDVSKDEMLAMEAKIADISLERTIHIISHVYTLHKYDQNFPGAALQQMSDFLNNPDVHERPDKHVELIDEMKMEAILSTENSPYAEVRAVCDPTDDPTMPSLTIRVWVIGCVFSAAGSFIDSFFLMRNPPVYIGANVAQLLSYPCGKFMAKVLPDKRFKLFGREHSLNPGKFNKKEHMLITIMAAVSFGASYTTYIVPTQALPFWFNEAYARNFGYQIMTSISINFVGYGLAGLTRRFLVYPAAAVWPSSLSTIALNKAFHTDENEAVKGPFGKIYTMSRQKFFMVAFGAMFIYFFFPGFIFQALSYFSWMTWISPNNIALSAITSPLGGLGLNPLPTFDWNVFSIWLVPLTIPTFSIMNQFVGLLIAVPMCAAIWFSNSWNTAYMPINDNHTFNNMGGRYNVTKILTDSKLDNDKYQAYSQPWMSAGYITSFFWYFALYGATVTYVILYHRQQIFLASKMVWRSALSTLRIRRHEEDDETDLADDVHARIMRNNYKDVPEWIYFITLVIAAAIGMVGIGIYPTQTSPVVVIFGIIMPLIVLIPVGLVQSVTGIQVAMNVLAEFIGGSFVEGNANALIWFKTFGYISCYQALAFSNDLKLAHYTHIKPYHTFVCQMVATLIFTFVSAGILNFQMSFRDVCTKDAQFGFTCPGHNTFFTSAVFWGTISPKKLFGPGRRYNMMLLGFPVGVMLPLVHWLLRRKYPRSELLRQIHPVMIPAGPALWGSPYNIGNFFPNVPVVWFSWQYLRRKYPGFWAKYNFVVAAAFPAGIAISAVVIFFALQLPAGGLAIDWWGNSVVGAGCDGGCPLLDIPEVGYFGEAPGSGKFI